MIIIYKYIFNIDIDYLYLKNIKKDFSIFNFIIYTLIYTCKYGLKRNIFLKTSKSRLKHNIFIKNKIITFQNFKEKKFINCIKLKRIIIKNTKIIPKYSFKNCIQLQRIFIDNNIKIIQHNAFENCISLNTVFIPKSIQKIESNAFKNCKKLKNIFFY